MEAIELLNQKLIDITHSKEFTDLVYKTIGNMHPKLKPGSKSWIKAYEGMVTGFCIGYYSGYMHGKGLETIKSPLFVSGEKYPRGILENCGVLAKSDKPKEELVIFIQD
jgi:hypothetical protein